MGHHEMKTTQKIFDENSFDRYPIITLEVGRNDVMTIVDFHWVYFGYISTQFSPM